MREIKFRAWDNGEYTYSDDYIGDGHEKVAILLSEFFGLDAEQYTGLKDKNGKEIYEGDIVEHEDDPPEGVYAGCEISFDKEYGIYCFKSDAPNTLSGYSNLEVVGNIHEH